MQATKKRWRLIPTEAKTAREENVQTLHLASYATCIRGGHAMHVLYCACFSNDVIAKQRPTRDLATTLPQRGFTATEVASRPRLGEGIGSPALQVQEHSLLHRAVCSLHHLHLVSTFMDGSIVSR